MLALGNACAATADAIQDLKRAEGLDLRRLGKVSEDERAVLRIEWRAGMSAVEEDRSLGDMHDRMRRMEANAATVRELLRQVHRTMLDAQARHYLGRVQDAAARMGLPVARLVIATNLNDSLARVLGSGVYEPGSVIATSSPSMDIQLASNFERLLFELAGRDAARVRSLMGQLRKSGTFRLNDAELSALRALFGAHAIGEPETAMTIRSLVEETGVLADPHTAVAVAAARAEGGLKSSPMVVLSTAHPAKFPEAVERACGRVPEEPERLRLRLGQHERCAVLQNDYGAVASFIEANAGAHRGSSAKGRRTEVSA